MKKLILIFTIVTGFSTTYAQKDIAVVNADTTIFCHSISEAITKSISGDTIYLPGRSFSESPIINKNLCIIGTGHYPDSTLASGRTLISGNITMQNGSSSGSIEGLYLTGTIVFSANHVINNYTIKRVNVNDINTSNRHADSTNVGLTVTECVVRGSIIGDVDWSNVLIEKSIIQSQCQYFDNNTLFIHNVFLYKSTYSSIYICTNCRIFSNVIMCVNAIDYDCTGCEFDNNIIVNNSAIGASNTITNCLRGVDWSTIFTNYDNSQVFSYDFDFSLKVRTDIGTSGLNVADLGLYDNTMPYKTASVPFNPHISEKSVSRETDNAGNINVQIKVAAQDK